MLILIWKVVLWDLIPKTKSTKEVCVVLFGVFLITIPVLLRALSNALQARIQHHLDRMFHYKKRGAKEQFDAHRQDLAPLWFRQKTLAIITLVVIIAMIVYRYALL